METQPPNRLSTKPSSPYYDKTAVDNVEVFLDGVRQVNNLVEYNVSAGWLCRYRKTALGKYVTDIYHQPIIDRLIGSVTVAWR